MPDLKEHASKLCAVFLCSAALSAPALAAPIVYGFDEQDDGTSVGNQYAGLAFSQATVLKAGFSLNEFAFPPRSLDNVLFDDGGAITIDFAAPVFSVGAYFTYMNGLSFTAYDQLGQVLGSVSGAWLNNLNDGSGDAGSSANEFLRIDNADGLIARVTFRSDAGGSSFVLDDLAVDAGTAVPEPSTLALMAGALCAALARRRRQRP